MALTKNKINVEIKSPDTIGQSVRINGWTYPLHWLQMIAWIVYLFMCLVIFAFIVPTLPNPELRCTMIGLAALVLVVHFITHVIAVNINPADDSVVDKLDLRRNRPTKFDRSKHSHVIENQFCYICETAVGSKSKHCSVCNKCVSDFDHHCKWLNNCVGGKNYRWFISCILSAIAGTVLIFVNCLILTIAYFSDDSWLYDETSTLLYFNSNSQINQSLQLFWIVIIIFSLILSIIAFLLLTHLLGFHLFLNCVGLSTYDFVVQQRKRKSENSLSKTNKPSFMAPFKTCLTATIRSKKRIKPLDIKNDLNQSEKHSISSSLNLKSSTEKVAKTYQNIDIEKGEIIPEINSTKSVSPMKEIQIHQLNVNNLDHISSYFTQIEKKEELPRVTRSPKITESTNGSVKVRTSEEISDKKELVTKEIKREESVDSFSKDEPIFKPLNPSFGQNGRMSRMSFSNQFVIPSSDSVSSDFGLKPKMSSNHTIFRYNTYTKLYINKNLRIDPKHKKLDQISDEPNLSPLKKIDINSIV